MAQQQALPLASISHAHSPPSPPREGLPAGTGGLILPWSALQLYPSDKALCVPSLSRFCLTLTIELRSFCYPGFGVSESAVAYLRKSWDTCALLIQFPHGWWPTRPDGCGSFMTASWDAIGGERTINDTKMFQPKVHPLYLAQFSQKHWNMHVCLPCLLSLSSVSLHCDNSLHYNSD